MHVELKNVSKYFQGQNGASMEVLQGISLSVEKGAFVCLLGPSGCGKSTIVNLIAGLEKPDSGQVLVNGKPVQGPGSSRTVVFQDAALFPWLDVLGNVEFGLRMSGMEKAERKAKAMGYIKMVHLSKFAHAYPHELSGGMRQRVAIARALAMEPEILLMDEPFGALDAQTRMVLQEELLSIWQKSKRTIFFVTHNVREATGLADRVYVISSRPGRIRAEQRIEVARPRHAESASLLAYQHKFLGILGEEIEKVMRDELGEEVHIKEASDTAPPDRSVGMHI